MLKISRFYSNNGHQVWKCIDSDVEEGLEPFYGYGISPIEAYTDYISLVISFAESYPEYVSQKDIKFVLDNCVRCSECVIT